MRRLVDERLLAWKAGSDRRRLLVRGARQVGKAWSIVDFGRTQFPGTMHVVDFEQRAAARAARGGATISARAISYSMSGTPLAACQTLTIATVRLS